MTGQSSLRELAESARRGKLEEAREKAAEERVKSLDKVMERLHDPWRGFGRLSKDGYEVPALDRSDFTFVKDVREFGGRHETHRGWRVEVDGVPFLFSTGYGDESFYVLHNCLQCGVEGASHLHGLDDLGKLLKFGPASYNHHCRDREAREVAYAIGMAAGRLRVSAQEMVDAAFELHSDVIYRLVNSSQD